MTVREIEIAITRLTAKDLAQLMAWFGDYRAQMWDKQIEEDLEAGRLDAVLAEVDAEYAAGLSQPRRALASAGQAPPALPAGPWRAGPS
jgi:hypothetical protein